MRNQQSVRLRRDGGKLVTPGAIEDWRVMLNEHNLETLRDYLRMHRADRGLIAWVDATFVDASVEVALDRIDGIPPELAWADFELFLRGLLQLLVDGPITPLKVQTLWRITDALQIDNEWRRSFIYAELGIDDDVLLAMACLRLALRPTRSEVKTAHRIQAKLHHPDRVAHMAEEFAALARRRTAQINAARDRIMEELDDLDLAPFHEFDDLPDDDASTEAYSESLTDVLELDEG